MLNVTYKTGKSDIARVYVAELEDGAPIEFVESVQPPFSRREKWVLIVSTLKGCPVGCPICDAGGYYRGKLSQNEILDQIDYLIRSRYPAGCVPVPKLKIQFARMGEPAFNRAVIDVLSGLPSRYQIPGLIPSISTVAPRGCDGFFEELLQVKENFYGGGKFQMQFSIHSTDEGARRRLIPIKTWSLEQMGRYGDRFFAPGDRKITLNFAPAVGNPLCPEDLLPWFSPDRFLVKLTPINPTQKSLEAGLEALVDPENEAACHAVKEGFERQGYDTILSIGELTENTIGSNCGMYISRARELEKRAAS